MAYKNREDLLAHHRKYNKKHKKKLAAQTRVWAAAHREELNLYMRLRRKENPSENAKACRKWRAKNHEVTKSLSSKRRALVLGNGGSHTAAQWLALKKKLGNKCLCCGLTERKLLLLGRVLAADHIQPLAKGGTDDINNIQPLCHGTGGCNNRKGTKHIDYRK